MGRQVEEDAGTWGVEALAMKLRARVAERKMSKPAAFKPKAAAPCQPRMI